MHVRFDCDWSFLHTISPIVHNCYHMCRPVCVDFDAWRLQMIVFTLRSYLPNMLLGDVCQFESHWKLVGGSQEVQLSIESGVSSTKRTDRDLLWGCGVVVMS